MMPTLAMREDPNPGQTARSGALAPEYGYPIPPRLRLSDCLARLHEGLRRLDLATRPVHPDTEAALRRRWDELPDHVKHDGQRLGRRRRTARRASPSSPSPAISTR